MKLRLSALLLATLLSACSREGEIGYGGVYTVRSACPIAAVPGALGDISLFTTPGRTDAAALDVSAAITHLRATCDESGSEIISTATFNVVAQRRIAGPARRVVVPYFSVAMRGGTEVAAKRIGYIALDFPAGALKTWAPGQATIRVSRSAATLPDNVRAILNERRKPGDPSAAVDPMSDPAVRAAVGQATFEHLVGFQLTPDQLRYNATR